MQVPVTSAERGTPTVLQECPHIFDRLIGCSPAVISLKALVARTAVAANPVLILGKSGTGKNLVAECIHLLSHSSGERMYVVDAAQTLGTLPRWDADLLKLIRGRTLFLDEVGDFSASLQAQVLHLLNAIEHGRHDQARGTRVIAATNRDIGMMLGEQRFREDLYYRLCGIKIELPPLCERREDIPALIHYFLTQAAKKYGKQLEGVTAEAHQTLMCYNWPGNVRELKNVIENMVVLSSEKRLGVESLPADVLPKASADSIDGINNLVGITIAQAEKELIRNTLTMVGGNRELAARMLGIGERTLYRKIKEYEL